MTRFAAVVTGTCTSHGVTIPAHIHFTHPCLPSPPPCPPGITPTKPLSVMDATCMWPVAPTTPEDASVLARTVFINGKSPLCDGDKLIPHISATTNLIEWKQVSGPNCIGPITAPCNCSLLSAEDTFGKGHPRVVKALGATVFVMGKRLAAIGDPLGPPCLSTIATGSENVVVGM